MKVTVSTTLEKETYERIRREGWRLNELITQAIHFKDMDIRDAQEYKERVEKMALLIDRLHKRLWELEGKFIEHIEK